MLKETPEGVILPVKITPKSSRNQLMGWENGELKIKIAALPEDGAANQELIKFLSKLLKVNKSNIRLVFGAASRHKRLIISNISVEELSHFIQNIPL